MVWVRGRGWGWVEETRRVVEETRRGGEDRWWRGLDLVRRREVRDMSLDAEGPWRGVVAGGLRLGFLSP